MMDLVLLTRTGCRNTAEMARNLEAALEAQSWPADYQRVDIGTLPTSDPRTGYPTPTVLYRKHDLFGMPEPVPPFPEPA